jgi:hypothetical protein
MRHAIVPSGERSEFRARARRARAHYVSAGCHYWLFEEAELPGAFVEFFEAVDAETLANAHAAAPVAPGPILDSARLYVEVDLS